MTFVQLNSRPKQTPYSICKSDPNLRTKFYSVIGVRWSYPDTGYFTTFKLEFITEPIVEPEWATDDIPF